MYQQNKIYHQIFCNFMSTKVEPNKNKRIVKLPHIETKIQSFKLPVADKSRVT